MTMTAGLVERRGRRNGGGARRGGGGGLETRDHEETQMVSATAYQVLVVYQTICITCVTSHSYNSARQVF